MKKEINKSNIIALALVYNYISNNQKALSMNDLNRFKRLIDIHVHNDYKEEIISDEEDLEQQFYYYDEKNNIILGNKFNEEEYINFRYIEYYYIESIPQSVFLSSLKDDVLNSINVDRNKLRIEKKDEHKFDVVGVYTLSEAKARKSAKEILELKGYKNIVTSFANTFQKDDKGYNVNVSYDEEVMTLDIVGSIQKILKN